MSGTLLKHTALAAALGCAISGPATAAAVASQDVVRLANMSLEELLQTEVTSLAGTAASQFTTAAAMTVLTGEDIRRSGHRTLPEALRLVPGMYVARVNASSWTVGTRGLTGSSLTANRYLVLIDGRLVHDPLTSGTFWDAVDIPLADVDRIEVISGPGATLWGVNAMNGVVNVITKDARTTLGTLLQAGAGTQGERRALLRHGAPTGENSAVRLWASYASQDEFKDAAGVGIDDGWSTVRAGVRWDGQVREDVDASVQAEAYGHPTADFTVRVPVPGEHNQFQVVSGQDTVNGAHLMARVGHAPSSEAGWSLMAYADQSERSNIRFGVERVNSNLEYRQWTPWGERQQLIWGGNWNWTRDDTTPGTTLLFDPRSRSWSTLNVFAQNTSELVEDTLFLMVGSKLTDHEFVGLQFQPSVRAWWTPSTKQTVWAAVSRPVRVPSRFEEDGLLVFSYADLGLLTTGQASGVIVPLGLAGDERLPAEKLVAYELGHRIQLSPRVALDTSVFYNDYRQLLGVPPAIIGAFSDQASGTTWGGDISVSARWTDRWRMEASYSRLNTDIRGPVLAFDETATPRQQAQLRSYLDIADTMELNVAAYYVDEVPFRDVQDYTRLDIGLSWRPWQNTSVSLWGQNLLDSGHSEGSGAQVPRGLFAQVTVGFDD
ncbi:TonB-dependent receptor plug domain-containing protein [Lysobacter sp. A3-1-A15]|uniref:TonB-dependent receptor plug domain-containing protein n=1 Tax=Novilysobacter viscosus TaxID=3098602 RepID=UPI002EDA6053